MPPRAESGRRGAGVFACVSHMPSGGVRSSDEAERALHRLVPLHYVHRRLVLRLVVEQQPHDVGYHELALPHVPLQLVTHLPAHWISWEIAGDHGRVWEIVGQLVMHLGRVCNQKQPEAIRSNLEQARTLTVFASRWTSVALCARCAASASARFAATISLYLRACEGMGGHAKAWEGMGGHGRASAR